MKTNKKSQTAKFWAVVLGLFLLIGVVSGGTYLLNEQGFISLGGEVEGERPSFDSINTENADDQLASRPTRGQDHEEAGGIDSASLTGILKMIAQLGIVVIAVTGFQWMYARLVNRFGRAPAA